MSDKKFTLYWLDGKRQVITGESIEQAYTQAGYGAGAIKAVDFYFDGDNHDYQWNKETRSWDRKEPLIIVDELIPKAGVIHTTSNAPFDYKYGADVHLVFTKMPETQEDEVFVTQSHLDKNKQSVIDNPGKFKLMVSHNLGATYRCEYGTDDKDDPELHQRIKQAKEKVLRYYVDGDDDVICNQHKTIIEFLGTGSLNLYGHKQRTIEEQAAMLRSKFGK